MPVLVDQLASLPWSHVLSFLFLCCTTQDKEPCIDNTQFFEDELWPFLESDCLSCHQEGGAASLSSFVLPSSPQDAEELVWNIGGRELSNTGTTLTLSKARGLSNPHFAQNNGRIYLNSSDGLISMRWDGTDQKKHVQVDGITVYGSSYDENHLLADSPTAPKKKPAKASKFIHYLYII